MSDEKKTTQLTGAFYLGGQRLDASNAETMEYVRSRFAAKPAQPVEVVDERVAFEAWARSEGHGCERAELGGYVFGATHSAWKGRQAALAHPRPTGDGMVSVSRLDLESLLECNRAAAQEATESHSGIDFIEARGGDEAEDVADRIAYHLYYSLFPAMRIRESLVAAPTGEQAGEVVSD